jgi:hypothetical protein
VNVAIRSSEAAALTLVTTHYAHMRAPIETAALTYTITRHGRSWRLLRDDMEPFATPDPGELLLQLDHDLIIQLQRLRHDLYFIHAGMLELDSKGVMLVAASGGGKSTTTWALVHHGFRYLSDELGPVDLSTLIVHPYPRALSLKTLPPRAYPLPSSTLATSRGFHIGADALSSGMRGAPARLAAIFFLRYARGASQPSACAISAAEAGARLYVNVLNALAHAEDGLDAAIRVTRHTPCFELTTSDLGATCEVVRSTVEALV